LFKKNPLLTGFYLTLGSVFLMKSKELSRFHLKEYESLSYSVFG